jgi:subfamily B ATP-binding cassette protein MsbA
MSKYLRILNYFRPDWGRLVLSLALVGVMTLLGLLWPFPLAILIDTVLGQKQVDHWLYQFFLRLAPEDRALQILTLAVAAVLLRVGAELLKAWQTLLGIKIGLDGMMRVRCDLFRKLQSLSIGYHRSQPQGDAIYRLAWDTYGFQGVVNVLLAIVVNALTLILMAAICFTMNWQLTLLSLSVVPLVLVILHKYSDVLRSRSIEAKERESSLYTAIQRSMSSITIVQAFNREADEYTRFDSTVRSSVHATFRLHKQEVIYWLLLGLSFALGTAAIFGYGGYLVYNGVVGVGFLTIFLAYLEKLYDPLQKLTGSGSGLVTAMAGVDRVIEVLDRDLVVHDAPGALALPRQPRALQLDHVSFAYRAGEPVVRDLHVTVPPGQMVAFIGSSGVGKTTLLNLLPRFYDPTEGAIRLDGHDLRQVTLASLRAHIALVLQESIILPTTIAENIAYGRPGATQAQIAEAARLAGAATFIEKLPEQYETIVQEGGSNLSGGQRQRIGIARALLTEAPIIVLDEPTSALDAEHEQLITETLSRLKGGRTIIIVSHRLSTVAECDAIHVMEAGEIIESGRHDELIARRGLYHRLAKHQMKVE